jgi:hypothetical protein
MWFAYVHCWATDAFSMDPLRDYISGTEPKHEQRKNEKENGASPWQLRKKGSAED